LVFARKTPGLAPGDPQSGRRAPPPRGAVETAPPARATQVRYARTSDRPMRFVCAAAYQWGVYMPGLSIARHPPFWRRHTSAHTPRLPGRKRETQASLGDSRRVLTDPTLADHVDLGQGNTVLHAVRGEGHYADPCILPHGRRERAKPIHFGRSPGHRFPRNGSCFPRAQISGKTTQ